MAYSNLEDILEQVAEATLIDLSDDDQVGAVNEAVIARAVAHADALIDAHCQDRYAVPFAPVPALARMFSVDIAVYNLYSRRPHVGVLPEAVKERHRLALAYLKRVQEGDAGMGVDAAEVPAASGTAGGLVAGSGRLFTRDQLRGL